MTKTDRYRQAILFGNPDRILLCPGSPRIPTLAAWREQGLPNGMDYIDAVCEVLHIGRDAFLDWRHLHVSFGMIPEFEPNILEHKDGHLIISDWTGAVTEIADDYDVAKFRAGNDFITRKWHRFPVENREDWERMKPRYDPRTSGRIAEQIVRQYQNARLMDELTSVTVPGVFFQLRDWCGFENLCLFMLEDPELVCDMAGFWADFVQSVLDEMLTDIIPDRVLINEDMAYKAHAMISPQMTREFILPAYRKWGPRIKRAGVPVIEIDSDGYIGELIPLWIEEGIHCCSPVEAAAHCDIIQFRDTYGKSMAYMQGIDKRIIAVGGTELEAHVNRIVPHLFRDGGYIPGCDHGVPPDISWRNYVELTRLLAIHSGWL